MPRTGNPNVASLNRKVTDDDFIHALVSGNTTQKALAYATGLTRGAVRNRLRTMIKKGWVKKVSVAIEYRAVRTGQPPPDVV